MDDQAPLCVRCGYPARGLEDQNCPECGSSRGCERPSRPKETLRLAVSPRLSVLGLLWRESDGIGRAGVNLAVASTLAGIAVVWAWLVEPIRGALAQPLSAATTLFHLVFVIALALSVLGLLLLMCEHALVLVAARVMRVARARILAWRISSISTTGLVLGGAATLVLVAVVRAAGLDGVIADSLPVGGALAGLVSWFRATIAGLWTAGLLRDAGW